jgi:cytochrome bd-type quinol oxidase subunit 2
MQDDGTNDVNKAAIKTVLKCGIPVATFGVFGLVVFLNPEASLGALGVIFDYFLSGLTFAYYGAGNVLRALDSVIFPITVIVILAFLWSACALNHLKSKGQTGNVYVQMGRVYTACLFSVLATVVLAALIWFSMIPQRSSEKTSLWCLAFFGFVISPIALYTLLKNKEILCDEGVNK